MSEDMRLTEGDHCVILVHNGLLNTKSLIKRPIAIATYC